MHDGARWPLSRESGQHNADRIRRTDIMSDELAQLEDRIRKCESERELWDIARRLRELRDGSR